jgi:hypothetical protein
VADAAAGLFDGHGKPRGSGVLDDLFGITRTNSAALGKTLLPITLDLGFPIGSTVGTVKVIRAENSVSAAGGLPLGSFGANSPALIQKTNGKGKAIFSNCLFSDYDLFRLPGGAGEPSALIRGQGARRLNSQALFQGILSSVASLNPAIAVTNSTPLDQPALNAEIIRYADGPAQYVMLWSGIAGAKSLIRDCTTNSITVRFPAAAHLYNLRQHAYLGLTNRVNAALVESQPLIFALLPEAVTNVTAAPDQPSYAKGSTARISVTTQPGNLRRHVYHVEVTDAQGKDARAHAANVNAPTNTVSVSIPLALDAATGPWQVRVTDVASGTQAVVPLNVQ